MAERVWPSKRLRLVSTLFNKIGLGNTLIQGEYYYPWLVKLFYYNIQREKIGNGGYSYKSAY